MIALLVSISYLATLKWLCASTCNERITASYRSDVIAYLAPIYVADFSAPSDLILILNNLKL